MDAYCDGADPQHCITCSDEGIAMHVIELDGMGTAWCADGSGAKHEVAVDLVGPLAPGDVVLVHAGVAIARPEVAA
jgi:hydrogenase maturation factor